MRVQFWCLGCLVFGCVYKNGIRLCLVFREDSIRLCLVFGLREKWVPEQSRCVGVWRRRVAACVCLEKIVVFGVLVCGEDSSISICF